MTTDTTFDFDLPGIDTRPMCEAGIDLPLKRVDGTPLLNAKKKPVSVHIYGCDSKAYRTASRVMARNRVDRAAAVANKKGLPDDEQVDANEADGIAMLVSCTSGWSGILDSKGNEVPFSAKACKAFYEKFPDAQEQVDRALIDRTLFITPSSEG